MIVWNVHKPKSVFNFVFVIRLQDNLFLLEKGI